MKGKDMKAKNANLIRYRRKSGDPLSEDVERNIRELLNKPDHEIDYSDIPPLTEEFWKNAISGRFYRPMKEAVSLRLDSDVVAWLKKDGKGYQTRANALLRQQMLAEMRKKA